MASRNNNPACFAFGMSMSIIFFFMFIFNGLHILIENNKEPSEIYHAWLKLIFFIVGLLIMFFALFEARTRPTTSLLSEV